MDTGIEGTAKADLLQHPHRQLRRDISLRDQLIQRVGERRADAGALALARLQRE